MKILITGAAGFIGFHVAHRLLIDGHDILGIDNLSPYYDVELKENRLKQLGREFRFAPIDISDRAKVHALFGVEHFDAVIHLAAQAGVRHSIKDPYAYVDANLVGFVNILEGSRQSEVGHLLYASSSSVYGTNAKLPYATGDNVDHPISLYAATKKANELMAHSYSHLYKLPTTGLRLFTVYGPWGRPDMAASIFTRAILSCKPIHVFNGGAMRRDFTYIDDVVEAIVRLIDVIPVSLLPSPTTREQQDGMIAPYRIINIGNHQSVQLSSFIDVLERCLGVRAIRQYMPLQPGDVLETCADISDLEELVSFRPTTTLQIGLGRFVDWYRGYYGIRSRELDPRRPMGFASSEPVNLVAESREAEICGG